MSAEEKERFKQETKKALGKTTDADDVLNTLLKVAVENNGDFDKCSPAIFDANMALGLENHFPATLAVAEIYRPLLVEVARSIELEYKCETASEKSLAEMIASAYIRSISYANKMNLILSAKNMDFSADMNRRFAVLSKEMDRAIRQYTNGIVAMRQIKRPPLTLNVNTKTAFVAQNQQINVNPKTNDQQ